jgi:hypothetical protein
LEQNDGLFGQPLIYRNFCTLSPLPENPFQELTDEDIELIRERAEQGDATLQRTLGWLYFNGWVVPQDYAMARKWLLAAAEQGSADAQYVLASMFYWGKGGVVDYSQAFVWFQAAAKSGLADGQYAVANMFDEGRGVPQDFTKAADWYLKAANQGHVRAQMQRGRLCGLGTGVPQDYVEAYSWFNLACALGKGEEADSARKARDMVADIMTVEQISEAQNRSAEWWKAHQKSE